MNERVVVPFEEFFVKGLDKWHEEVVAAESYRVFEMKPARIYNLDEVRRVKRLVVQPPNNVA